MRLRADLWPCVWVVIAGSGLRRPKSTAAKVRTAIERGVGYLRTQAKGQRLWPDYPGNHPAA